MAKEDKMIEAVRNKSRDKVNTLKKIVDKMVSNNERITTYTVWKKSGLSKSFLYNNPAAVAYIEKYKSVENIGSHDSDGVPVIISKAVDFPIPEKTKKLKKMSKKELKQEIKKLRARVKELESQV